MEASREGAWGPREEGQSLGALPLPWQSWRTDVGLLLPLALGTLRCFAELCSAGYQVQPLEPALGPFQATGTDPAAELPCAGLGWACRG